MGSEPARWNPTGLPVGTAYLLHFRHPYRHARHYLGFATNLNRRLAWHLKGWGSPLLRAVIEAGIDIYLVRTWQQVTVKFERRGHRRRHSDTWCPICHGPLKGRAFSPRADEVRPGFERACSFPAGPLVPLRLEDLRPAVRRGRPLGSRSARKASERASGGGQ
jgi:hypothetical protein